MLLYTHPRCLDHVMQPRHPESPGRLRAVLEHLNQLGLLADLDVREPAAVSRNLLERVHDARYLERIAAMLPKDGLAAVDPDTYLCPNTLAAAAVAAGAVAEAVDAVLGGDAQRAFCAVRPPGHHAEHDLAMGFCFYNNVAVGAAAALAHETIERVAVLDFDVHHGNGTVDIFKDRPEVLVCSSYQHPFYPNRATDVVRDHIVHTRLAAGSGSDAFRRAIERDWLPAIDRHRPQLFLVSAGFDAHRGDPLAALDLVEDDYRWITRHIVRVADQHANGRIVSTLEGGYDLDALARSVAAHVEMLNG